MTTSNMEEKLSIFLKSIGISGRYKGFYYLKEAVFLVMEDEHCLCNIQKEIYRPIGRNVSRLCPKYREGDPHCLQVAAANGSAAPGFFPGFLSHGTLYPKELIEMAADYLRYQ